jgi:hypothetical protein
MGKGTYTNRIRAAIKEVDAAAKNAEKARTEPDPGGKRAAAYERELRAGGNVWRALVSKDPK